MLQPRGLHTWMGVVGQLVVPVEAELRMAQAGRSHGVMVVSRQFVDDFTWSAPVTCQRLQNVEAPLSGQLYQGCRGRSGMSGNITTGEYICVTGQCLQDGNWCVVLPRNQPGQSDICGCKVIQSGWRRFLRSNFPPEESQVHRHPLPFPKSFHICFLSSRVPSSSVRVRWA